MKILSYPKFKIVFMTLVVLGMTIRLVCAQAEIEVKGYRLLAVNELEKGYSYFPGYYFETSNTYATPAINSKGKSIVRYYKLNSKGLIKFKNEEDVFIPSSYELSGNLSFSPGKEYFIFSGMNGSTREPDMYFAAYNKVWKHYNIRLLGELNEYGAIEKNLLLTNNGNRVFYLVKGQLFVSFRKPGDKVFGFPDKVEFSGMENKELDAVDVTEDGSRIYVLKDDILYSSQQLEGFKFKTGEVKTELSYSGFIFSGFHITDKRLILFAKSGSDRNKPELLIFEKN